MNWIAVNECLPEPNQRVIAYVHEDATQIIIGSKRIRVVAVNFVTDFIGGNNHKPYAWEDGPMKWFGQDVTHWMPVPESPLN